VEIDEGEEQYEAESEGDDDSEVKYKLRKITTKMHELIEHVTEQLPEIGQARSSSAKLLETFHLDIVEVYQRTSHRKDGVALKEIIETFAYRQLDAETECRVNTVHVSKTDRNRGWYPMQHFRLIQNRTVRDYDGDLENCTSNEHLFNQEALSCNMAA
jgi:hypothetical protein